MNSLGSNGTLFRERYDWSETDPSLAILEALATIEETDPIALFSGRGRTLYDHVDPEALDSLVESATEIDLSVPIGGYRVRIDGEELAVDSA